MSFNFVILFNVHDAGKSDDKELTSGKFSFQGVQPPGKPRKVREFDISQGKLREIS